MGYYDEVNTKGRGRLGYKSPGAGSAVNDTTLPKGPKVVRPSIGTRMGNAIAPRLQGAGSNVAKLTKGAGKLAFPLALLQSTSSEVAPEDRLFPNFGNVADGANILVGQAYEKGGTLPAVGEFSKSIIPSIGGLMTDIRDTLVPDFVNNAIYDFKNDVDDPNHGTAIQKSLGSGIELTPGAVEGIKTGIPYKSAGETSAETPVATPAANTSPPVSQFDQLLLNQLGGQGQPEAPAVAPVVAPTPVNNSYFINNQTGEAPGEKQYFRDLPGTTLNDPQLPQRLPQRLQQQSQQSQQQPVQAESQSPAYESPMVAATKNMNLAQFDPSRDSFGDLFAKQFHNINEAGKLIPALAQTREQAEQQRRSEEDRGFGLEALNIRQDNIYDTNNLALGRDELIGRDRRSNIDNLVRLRGQDVVSATSRANNITRSGSNPLTFTEQLEEENSLTELNLRDFINAPPGFAEAASRLIQRGATRPQLRDAYNRVSAIQAKNTGSSVDELDAQKLYNAVEKALGQSQ